MSDTKRDLVFGSLDRHTNRNGLCAWCCCAWPCDARLLAEHMDELLEVER